MRAPTKPGTRGTKPPKRSDKPPPTANKRLAEQTRKILGKHYANNIACGEPISGGDLHRLDIAMALAEPMIPRGKRAKFVTSGRNLDGP